MTFLPLYHIKNIGENDLFHNMKMTWSLFTVNVQEGSKLFTLNFVSVFNQKNLCNCYIWPHQTCHSALNVLCINLGVALESHVMFAIITWSHNEVLFPRMWYQFEVSNSSKGLLLWKTKSRLLQISVDLLSPDWVILILRCQTVQWSSLHEELNPDECRSVWICQVQIVRY